MARERASPELAIQARIDRLAKPHALTKGEADRIRGFEERITKIKAKKTLTKGDERHLNTLETTIKNLRNPYITGKTKGKIRRLKKKIGAK